ncbi:MAG: cytochrome c oxidase subunit II, partial [Chloroflexi bacterium]
QYPELGITTANELILPVDRPVAVSLQSVDVIHSFWVPQLTGKVDNVPGHTNHLWFTANEARPEPYLGQCAEFCGLSHANMRFRVFVKTTGDFDTWSKAELADRKAPTSDLAKAGEQQFLTSGCIACHTVKGNPVAVGKIGPNLTHFGSRTTLASGTLDSNTENIKKWLHNPPGIKPGSLMPNLNLSQGAIDKLTAYLQELK